MLCKGLTAPALPAFPGRELIAGKGSDGTNGKNSTPLQGLIFSKAVSAVMDDLGIDDKIIENLNIIIKIWQLEVAT